MHNPYSNTGPNLENAATRIIAITPQDGVNLAQVCKGLRIWNPEATAQTVHFTTVGGDTITVTVPPASVTVERAVVTQVQAAGTGGTLVIHGYSD